VEATDSYSTPGIITVDAVEYYSNDHEDDINSGLVGALIEENKDPNPKRSEDIVGDVFIKPKTT
jgi:hypothetical protein